mmetsp:Transcript_17678/g.20387  ORF Transcript_17678/g.20387 Transcript_17678/m.20387 type:complete len:684 (+) Transcript_17678:118-2169(+)
MSHLPLLNYVDVGGCDKAQGSQHQPVHFPYQHQVQHHQGGIDTIRLVAEKSVEQLTTCHHSTLLQNAGNASVMARGLIYPPSANNNIQRHLGQPEAYYQPHPQHNGHNGHGRISTTVNGVVDSEIVSMNNSFSSSNIQIHPGLPEPYYQSHHQRNGHGWLSTVVNGNGDSNVDSENSRPTSVPLRLPFVPVLESPTHNNCSVTVATEVNEKHYTVNNNPDRPQKVQQQQQQQLVQSSTNNSQVVVEGKTNKLLRITRNENRETKTNTSNNVQKKFKKKRRTNVHGITEWTIPSDTEDKYEFILSSLQQGLDPDNLIHYENKPKITKNYLSSHKKIDSKIKRKNRKKTNDGKTTKTIVEIPKITGAAFDNRFLEYKLLSTGNKQKEKLTRSLLSFKSRHTDNKAWENYIEKIPDEPPRSKTSSRVGPLYQAQISSKAKLNGNFTEDVMFYNSSLPGYDTLWDPKRAKEAEERGEDISGFLEGEHGLSNHELLFSMLHNNDYCVKSARIDYERVKGLYDGCTSSKLNREESRKFDVLIKENQKDFSLIAKALKRKRSDCLIHYYVWKTNNRSYPKMKRDWKEHCSVCDNGGDLIICDGCNYPFHTGCVKPPLTTVPEGEWFCHLCTDKKVNKRIDLLSPMSSGRRRVSLGSRASPCSSKNESDVCAVIGNSISIPTKKKSSKVLF